MFVEKILLCDYQFHVLCFGFKYQYLGNQVPVLVVSTSSTQYYKADG